MRILIFSTAYLPFVGGAELAIKEITDRLGSPSPLSKGGIEGGISFSLITARFKRSVPVHERLGNIDIYRVGFGTPFDKWLLPWLGLRKAQQLEKEQKSDCIWSMMASQASIAAAWFKNRFPNKRLVLTLQEGDEEEHLRRYVFGIGFLYRLLIRPWYTLIFEKADAITAISNYLADRARRNSSVEVEVIPNGVSLQNFQPPTSDFQRTELRKTLGFAQSDTILITTSRLVEKNGVGDLIEAMRYLPEHVKLLILGSGSLLSDLQCKTSNLQLTERVTFLGHIAHAELPRYLHASDIFVRASRSEGMGSSFIEAMAAGLPVVATPIGGIPDFLTSPPFQGGDMRGGSNSDDKITGLFCRVGDPKDIARKIQLLLSDNELRNRIISNASKMVREKYDWDGIAGKMKVVFDTAVARV